MKRKTTKRGGARSGAGRPIGSATKEPTVVMRVPESLVDRIKSIIKKAST